MSPNEATWKNTAALLVMLAPEERVPAIGKIGEAMFRAGHDPDFIADEMQWLADCLGEMLAGMPLAKGVH